MQSYIKIFYILIIIIFIFIIFNIINKNIKEYFTDTTGNIGGSESNSDSYKTICSDPGSICIINEKYGTCNKLGVCILQSNDQSQSNQLPPPPGEEGIPPPPGEEGIPPPPDCLPNITDFYQYCANKGSSYGLEKIIPCDSNNSRAICSNTISIDSDISEVKTPCLNKSDDFNEWCRYYSNNPSLGYNVNSIGAKKVLIGKNGGCYVNGKSDESKAIAICTANYTDEVPKLDPANEYIDYNSFTQCMPLNKTDFISECKKALNTDYSSSFADQIGSYDCNPGFGRAKCLFGTDKYIFNNNFQNETFYKNSAIDTIKKYS